MDTLFLEYHDPIFGIIIFFSIMFLIAFLNYWWGVFKNKEERRNIELFIKRFEVMTDNSSHKKLFDEFNVSSESLGLLAHTYSKSGEYEKAIGIYLIALKKTRSKQEKQYLLFELGKVYVKAGFLRRGSEVLLELLRIYPRHKEALKLLTVICEQLQEYESSLDALDALEELGENVKSDKMFIKALQTLKDKAKTAQQKIDALSNMAANERIIGRMIFEFAKRENLKIDNKLINSNDIVDLLWTSDLETLTNLDDPIVSAIKAARGKGEMVEKMPFEMEVLAYLNKIDYKKATISFEYICDSCKGTFPVHFYRCPSCHNLKNPYIAMSIVKSEHEKYYSF